MSFYGRALLAILLLPSAGNTSIKDIPTKVKANCSVYLQAAVGKIPRIMKKALANPDSIPVHPIRNNSSDGSFPVDTLNFVTFPKTKRIELGDIIVLYDRVHSDAYVLTELLKDPTYRDDRFAFNRIYSARVVSITNYLRNLEENADGAVRQGITHLNERIYSGVDQSRHYEEQRENPWSRP